VKRVVDEFVDREVLTLNLTECDQTHREHVIRSWFVRK
jgi:hypothetical protein